MGGLNSGPVWLLIVCLLHLITPGISAQPETPTPSPPVAAEVPLYEQLYGKPVAIYEDLANDLFACQDPSAAVGAQPTDITQLAIYSVPSDIASAGSWLVLANTATPFQQILNESYSAALSVQARSADGQMEVRLYEIHEAVTRIGAADSNLQLIEGTHDLVALTPDGTGVLFSLPGTVDEFLVRSFYSAAADSDVVCDTSPDTNWLPLHNVGYDLSNAAYLTTINDAHDDTLFCGVGGAGNAPQADVVGVDFYRAPADAQFANGWYIVILSNQPPGDVLDSAARYSASLNLFRGTGEAENWVYDSITGQEYNRVLDVNFAPIEGFSNFAVFNVDRSELLFHVPADVTGVQISTSLAINTDDTPLCDLVPDTDRFDLPATVPATSTPGSRTPCPSVEGAIPPEIVENILNTGSKSAKTQLELYDADAAYHPIYNPLIWRAACLE